MKHADEIKKIQEALVYFPDTGQLIWRKDRPAEHFTRSNEYQRYLAKNAGQPVKICLNSGGYAHVRFGYKIYGVHRLAFVLMHGRFPDHIDHLNGMRSDNRWANLREVPKVLNARNRQKPSNNTSGITGVSWHKTKKRWITRVSFNGKEKHLGAFLTFEEAVQARAIFFNEHKYLGYTDDHGIR